MHPIERLRAMARARDVEQTRLATEAALVLGSMAFDPLGLLTSCRRLIDRHPAAGALWWTCARLLPADDARAEARAIVGELDDDPAQIDLSLELPGHAVVSVVPDAAGGSDLARHLAQTRDDLQVVDADEPAALWWEDVDPRPPTGPGTQQSDEAGAGPGDADAAQHGPARILLIETGAAGPDRFLAVTGTAEAVADARRSGATVWLVVAVGRRLPGPLFDAVVASVGPAGGDVLRMDQLDRVIEPRRVPCPCPPELLRPSR